MDPAKATDQEEPHCEISKKAAKKAEKASAKEAKKQAQAVVQEEQRKAAEAILEKVVSDVNGETFGYLPFTFSAGGAPLKPRTWTKAYDLDDAKVETYVWLRGHMQDCRIQGPLGFLTCRNGFATVQLVLDSKKTLDKAAIKWAGSVPLESVIDVYGKVQIPEIPITSTSQKVEVHVEKIFCFSKSMKDLPFQLKDANRPVTEDTVAVDDHAVTVGQDVRLDNRILDLRTRANQAIFKIQAMTCQFFREYLMERGFTEIHTPKLISGVSEGGANAFTLQYFGRPACLAQSPQLYKQMALCADMDRVFEIAPVFRAENSNTHRHLCEFTGLDLEMTFYESYHEVLDLLNGLFNHMFEGLSTRGASMASVVRAQFDVPPFEWIAEAPRLTYQEGIQMLRDHGVAGIPDDVSKYDLSTENEKLLGKLVKEKYKTDFYMLIKYPLGVRPFYTMPDPHDPSWSNSYDLFMRGEEIVSGAQRVHCPDLLTKQALSHGIDVSTLQAYVDAFKLGTFPHGGAGIGLERVVMLFLGLGNIRRSTMFPRDPKRLTP